LARICGRDRLGERWPVLPLLEHDARCGRHPGFPGAAAQEDDARHATPREAAWPPRIAEHPIIRFTGIKRKLRRYSLRQVCVRPAPTGCAVDPRYHRARPPEAAAEDTGRQRRRGGGVPFQSTKRRRLNVGRRRGPHAGRSGRRRAAPPDRAPGARRGAASTRRGTRRRRRRKKVPLGPIFLLQSRQNTL
jgi:hypothetical protein